MTSLLERLDDLIRGSLHRLVDRALESSSLALFDQDVRDMDDAIAHVEEAAASMYAAARANERQLARHGEEVERLEQRVERLAAEGAEPTSERVMVAQAQLEATRGLVAETQTQIERQQAQYETLARSQAELKVRSQTLQDTRPRLESLLVLARAYRSIEQVELTLEGLRGLGGDTDIAMVADSIYQRLNEAQVRQEMIQQVEDLEMLVELEQAEVDDELAQRRRRLGLEPEPEVTAPPASPAEPAAPDEPAPPPAPPAEPAAPDEPAPPPVPPAEPADPDEPAPSPDPSIDPSSPFE
jgi:phage shock protein A